MLNLEQLDIDGPRQRKINFDMSKFAVNTLVGSFNVLSLSLVLYPLERVQQIRQIQSTYSSESLKFCKNVLTRCSHFGIRSIFRGLKVTLIKNSMLYSLYEFINTFEYRENRLAENIFKGLVASAGYFMIYPLENIKLRMAADLQQDRYYSNVRDCIKKVKKHEGTKALYRGFSIASVHLISQYFLIRTLINQRENNKDKISNPLIFSGLFLTSFAAYEILLYPLDTLKKNIQINGSLGHDDYNKTIRKTFKNLTFANFFNGLPIRMANSACYVVLSMLIGRIGNNQH